MSDIVFYSILFFIWFLITIFYIRSILNPQPSKSKTLPSPPSLPIIGHLYLLGSVIPKSLQTLATSYGPLMRLRLASTAAVIVSDAATAEELLKNNEMNFLSRPSLGASDFDIYNGTTFMLAEYGPYWRFMKKLCMTELLSAAQVNRFADIRREETMKLMETLVKCSYRGEAYIDLGQEIMSLTNNVICRMVMSTRCSGNANESKLVWDLVKGIQLLTAKLSLGEILGPFAKLDLFGHGRRRKILQTKFDLLVETLMEEHEKKTIMIGSGREKEREDAMDIILKIYRNENDEMKLTRSHIKSFIFELFVAGTETTSVILQWIMAELINHPEVLKKLREEIDTVVGSKSLAEESDIPNLPYLRAVVKECLRLHPSTPLMIRKCDEDCKINGYDIFANERIIFNLYAIMRDPNSWENPLNFIPERFIIENKVHYDHNQIDMKLGRNFKMLPFGSGRRGCPGASLALAIIHGVTAKLVQCFDFEVQGGGRITMEEGSGFSSSMAHPLLCSPIIRINPRNFPVF